MMGVGARGAARWGGGRKKSESWPLGGQGRQRIVERSGVPFALLFLVSCKARRQEGNGGDAMDADADAGEVVD